MNLNHLNDETLDAKTLELVKSEREILADILNHLREVERRRLFSKYNMSSLFDYAIKRLGYSEDQAARRISAMRLLRDLPAIEQKVVTGALTLTHLSKAQTLFRQEKKASFIRSNDEKIGVLEKLENSSKVQTEKTLKSESFITQSHGLRFEIESRSKIELSHFDKSLQEKLKRLMEIKRTSATDLHSLIEEMADLALKKWDPVKKAERSIARAESKPLPKAAAHDSPVPAPVRVNAKTRSIPSAIRHAVYFRDGGKCRNCRSAHAVEIDHIVPFSKGGSHDLYNLRLLCRACNQRHAIESFGSAKMASYLKSDAGRYFLN
jgi:hypothetical protein